MQVGVCNASTEREGPSPCVCNGSLTTVDSLPTLFTLADACSSMFFIQMRMLLKDFLLVMS